ncbi:unnamed protein product [Amoebophrya sp. A25]|nr:unnamed protein product [Amoebophrya sp. A25]|eukprot:GSA25T00027461001.1
MACCAGAPKRGKASDENCGDAPTAAPAAAASAVESGSAKTYVIFGGLGRQGESVATQLLKAMPDVTLRLVTRGDVDTDKAKKACEGKPNVSVVQAQLENPETLEKALEDAYGCFLVTAFWPAEVDGGSGATSALDPAFEKKCGLNCLEACKKMGVKHLVFSTLENTTKCKSFNQDGALKADANGYLVPHFDAKGEVSELLNQQQDVAVDHVMVGFYYGNWFGMKPTKGEDGKYALYFPLGGKPHFQVHHEDVGKVVAPLFKRGLPKFGEATWSGEPSWPVTGCIGNKCSGEELAAAFTKIIGEEVTFVDVPVQGWIQTGISMGMPEIVCTDFGHMFQFYQTEEAIAIRDKALAEYKGEPLTKFEDFLGAVKDMLYPPEKAEEAA